MDCYGILEVERDASPREIKKAYHRMAKKYHPDVGGDEETFKMIAKAYEILSDTLKREMFDRDGTILNDSEDMINDWVRKTFIQMISAWLPAKIDGTTNLTFPEMALAEIESNRQKAENGIKEVMEKRKGLKRYERFASVKDGENIFTVALERIRADLDAVMCEYNTLLYRVKALEKEFERYEFVNMDEDDAMAFINHISTDAYANTFKSYFYRR